MDTNTAPLQGPVGASHPDLSGVRTVPLGSIVRDPKKFQVRNPKALAYSRGVLAEMESMDHIGRLAEAVLRGEALDPIFVWRSPNTEQLFVIDGFHRTEAYLEAGLGPDAPIPVQELLVDTEVEAREAALAINRKGKLRMDPKESQDVFWKALLCGEVSGSYRQIEARYEVSRGTIGRMQGKREAVLSALRRQAGMQRVPFDSEFIRTNAPPWRSIFKWEQSQQGKELPSVNESNDVERYRIGKEKIKRAITRQFGARLLRNRTMGREALQEILEEIFGDTSEDGEMALSDPEF